MKQIPNRTIKSILDLKTGKEISASDFFNQPMDEIFKFRYNLETDIREKKKRYVCFFCKQNIKIRGKGNSLRALHFAHLKDSKDCIIKTDNRLTREEIQRIKYNGAKESDLHHTLKHKIAFFLEENQKTKGEVGKIEIEVIKRDEAIPKIWKKPDISTLFNNERLVIELQLSTTFLSVINDRQEFYKRNNTFILWVFHHFETQQDRRKFTQSDVFYNNNRNGFEFDQEAINLSNQSHNLILNCHYEVPYIQNNNIAYQWKNEYVNLNQLTFDKRSHIVYFFDVEKKKKELEKHLHFEHSRLMSMLKTGNLMKVIEVFLLTNLTEEESQILNKLYKEKIKPLQKIEPNSKEEMIIWAIILNKLAKNNLVQDVADNYRLRKVIIDILCLKTDKIIGYSFKNQIQIAHNLLHRQPQYMSYYSKAIKKYGNIGNDKNNKLKLKIERIKEAQIEQVLNNKVLDIIFSELI